MGQLIVGKIKTLKEQLSDKRLSALEPLAKSGFLAAHYSFHEVKQLIKGTGDLIVHIGEKK